MSDKFPTLRPADEAYMQEVLRGLVLTPVARAAIHALMVMAFFRGLAVGATDEHLSMDVDHVDKLLHRCFGMLQAFTNWRASGMRDDGPLARLLEAVAELRVAVDDVVPSPADPPVVS